jgi:hypothetical protein
MIRKACLVLLCFGICLSSCTLVIKSLARVVVRDYDNHTNINLSGLQLIDTTGNQKSFSEVFAGKAVYLYIWEDSTKRPPSNKDKRYTALKQRFEKYPDVTFASLSLCKDCKNVSGSYRLILDQSSDEFTSIVNLFESAPFIIGKDGQLLAYKGPKPSDDLLVDYVLYEARNGIDGRKSARKLINGVNKRSKFKNRALREWYSNHFEKDPNSITFNFSSTK